MSGRDSTDTDGHGDVQRCCHTETNRRTGAQTDRDADIQAYRTPPPLHSLMSRTSIRRMCDRVSLFKHRLTRLSSASNALLSSPLTWLLYHLAPRVIRR